MYVCKEGGMPPERITLAILISTSRLAQLQLLNWNPRSMYIVIVGSIIRGISYGSGGY